MTPPSKNATGGRPGIRPADSLSTHALVLEGVSRDFGALRALNMVDLEVAAGERRAILGANGAGKTTLFNAITGDFPPTTGRIRFFGEDITALPPYERTRRGLRRTYQSSMLFKGLTVLDNLFLAAQGIQPGRFAVRRPGPGHAALAPARELAAFVHLDRVAHRLVAELSHGQQRQLEVGMALAGAPRLILLDEPAAGLSPAERQELVTLLRGLPRHLGFVIIEHDLDIALAVVERVTVMHNGSIFKHGTPAEIQDDPDVQRIYLGEGHAGIAHGGAAHGGAAHGGAAHG